MNEYRASRLRFIEDKIIANIIYLGFLFIVPIIALYFSLQTRDEVLNSFNANKEVICKVSSFKYFLDFYFIKYKNLS